MSIFFSTKDDLRRWLARSKRIESEIERAREVRRNARDRALRTTVSYSGFTRFASHDHHRLFDAIAEAEEKICDLIIRQAEIQLEILNFIYDSPLESLARTCLVCVYVRGCTFDQAAKEIELSVRQIRRIHNTALDTLLSANHAKVTLPPSQEAGAVAPSNWGV